MHLIGTLVQQPRSTGVYVPTSGTGEAFSLGDSRLFLGSAVPVYAFKLEHAEIAAELKRAVRAIDQIDAYSAACLALEPRREYAGVTLAFDFTLIDPSAGWAINAARLRANEWADNLRSEAVRSIFASIESFGHNGVPHLHDLASLEREIRESGGRANPEQRQKGALALAALASVIEQINAQIDRCLPLVSAFSDGLSADYDRLMADATAIPAFRAKLLESIRKEEMKYLAALRGVETIGVIEFLSAEWQDDLDDLLVSLSALNSAKDDLRDSLTLMRSSWTAMQNLAWTIVKRLEKALDGAVANILQDLDLGESIASWAHITEISVISRLSLDPDRLSGKLSQSA